MLKYQSYLTKAEHLIQKEELENLAKELGITEYSLNEDGESVAIAGWPMEEGYAYFFKKERVFASDLTKLKNSGLTLVIDQEEAARLGKSLDLSQFSVEIIGKAKK